jgi:multiple sugar transport system ATP-binding protein
MNETTEINTSNGANEHTMEDRATTDKRAERSADHIRIEELRKTFDNGTIVACDDVNINIAKGEFVVLVGPSGCGKTTTLRCIAGLEDPDEGQIHVDDEEITHRKSKDRNLAFVFQSIALFPHMSVRKNIRFGLDMNTDLDADEKEYRVKEVTEMLGLEGMLDRKPSALSGGQRQRVSLGRAMVMEPAAFLLDEPFSALDANLRDQMRVEVKKIQRNLETSMIFVTHDQEEAMTLGDRIVVMDDGHIQQIGSPHDIYNEPINRFVANFIGSPSPNLLDCEVRERDETIELVNEIFTIEATAEQHEQLRGRDGERVTYGIRPEYLNLVGDDPNFEAEIDVIEPLGDRDAVHLSANGRSLSAITPQGEIRRETRTTGVDLRIEKGWIFNTDGDRLI